MPHCNQKQSFSSRSSPGDIKASRQVRSLRIKEYLQGTRRHSTGESVQAEFAIYLCLLSICQIRFQKGFSPDRIQVNLEFKDITLQSLHDPK